MRLLWSQKNMGFRHLAFVMFLFSSFSILLLPIVEAHEIYGADHLHPSPDSPLGLYLRESGAYSFARRFAINGVEGPPRLIVSVSETSFPILAKYFSGRRLLHFFHEPYTHMVQTAYNGKRGSMGRLVNEFRYTQSGVDLIPIYLDDRESDRLSLYFQLADATMRRFDVASFPWLLLDPHGVPYMRPGNKDSLSEWFARLPVGIGFDQTESHNSYRKDGLKPEASALVDQVWSVPYSHQSLIQTLGLTPYDAKRGFNTPGLLAISLLASASVERVPVFFRFVVNHQAVLDKDFNLWIDLKFDPDKEPKL